MKKWILNGFNTKMYGSDMNRVIMASKIPDQKVSLTRLKSIGFSPLLIFDVGGYKGEFSEMCLEIWNGAEVHLFEGLPDKIGPLREKFKGLKVKVNECLVGDKDASEVQFYADETASSVLYSEEVNYKKQLVTQSMCCLDSYINRNAN